MEIIITGGIVIVLLGIWYIFHDAGGPNLESGEWYIDDVDSTNEKEGDKVD